MAAWLSRLKIGLMASTTLSGATTKSTVQYRSIFELDLLYLQHNLMIETITVD
jgi:hypothetical protein